MMEYLDSYFEDEVISGYYVDSRMKCAWAAQVEVLNRIDEICQKYNIQYFVEWGSMLGTVRHGGFIPWDDDLDIAMKRIDFERFLKVANEELPDYYHVMSYHDAGYYDIMARVINGTSLDFSDKFLDEFHNMPFVCGVDIFPLDYVAKDKQLEKLQYDIVMFIKTLADVSSNDPDFFSDEELENQLSKVEILTGQSVDRNGNLKEQLYKLLFGMYAIYSEEESDRVALMHLYLEDGGCVYPKEYYADSIRMPFDKTTIPVPIGYDSILSKKYGNYMKSVRKGGSHNYPFYEVQETEYLNQQGYYFPQYKYEMFDGARRKNPTFIDNLEKKIELLKKLHMNLAMLFTIGDYENIHILLENAQNLAVVMGTLVENKYGTDTSAVRNLEQYCEVVYEIANVSAQGHQLDAYGIKDILDETLSYFETELAKLTCKKEIVFMVDRITHWKAVQSLYIQLVNDSNNIVKVIALPYFYKYRNQREMGPIIDDNAQFPDFVHMVSYAEYDFINNHPDITYIVSPYDEYNYTISVHPDYYSTKLWPNTDKLIYIPWFKIDELSSDDERGLKSRKYFVPMPGVVNADEVIVQSEVMKASYVDYLCDWAGEDTRSIWEEKILATGLPIDKYDEHAELLKLMPNEWQDKKLLLYYVSGNSLIEHEDRILEKIEKNLETFAASSDSIQVIWVQDDALVERFYRRIPETLEKYLSIVENAQHIDNVCIFEPSEREKVIMLADAYYGDTGRYAQAMIEEHKPVMIQNVEV